MRCGNRADWECVRVLLGMGEADCDFAGDLYRLHICGCRNRVVVREVREQRDPERSLLAAEWLRGLQPNEWSRRGPNTDGPVPTERPHHQERGRPDSMTGRVQSFYPGRGTIPIISRRFSGGHCPYTARGPWSYLMATTPGPGPLPVRPRR